MLDEATDELASYFNRETLPKLLITTCDRPGAVSYKNFVWSYIHKIGSIYQAII